MHRYCMEKVLNLKMHFLKQYAYDALKKCTLHPSKWCSGLDTNENSKKQAHSYSNSDGKSYFRYPENTKQINTSLPINKLNILKNYLPI